MNESATFVVLNQAPPLFGPSSTSFTYEILGLSKKKITKVFTLSTIADKFQYINTKGIFKFIDVENQMFRNNLILVDGLLPDILSEVIIYAYKNNCFKLSEILQLIERTNPLCFKTVFEIKFYTYKIKEFLRNLALGMNASSVWNGAPNIYDYFPVMKVGNELIYYSDKNFIDVLLDTAYIGNNIDEAVIFSEDEKLYIKVKFMIELMTKK